MPISSYSYIVSPLVALVALGLIVLMCRWVFSTSTRDQRLAQRRARAGASDDYGLLVPVATARTREDAELLRGVLAGAGLRGTVAPAPSGELSLLVFRDQEARARQVLVSS